VWVWGEGGQGHAVQGHGMIPGLSSRLLQGLSGPAHLFRVLLLVLAASELFLVAERPHEQTVAQAARPCCLALAALPGGILDCTSKGSSRAMAGAGEGPRRAGAPAASWACNAAAEDHAIKRSLRPLAHHRQAAWTAYP
jgi:hypothetical protein